MIQVCYDLSEIKTKNREVSSILKASKELRCKNLTIITWDHDGVENKIKFISLWKWLLE